MRYIDQLTDSIHQGHPNHFVPFIYEPPQLVKEFEVNGYESMEKIFDESTDIHFSRIKEYECRICLDRIPHDFSVIHLHYGSTYTFSGHFDLLSEHIYGCCESCVKKICRGEIDHEGKPKYIENN